MTHPVSGIALARVHPSAPHKSVYKTTGIEEEVPGLTNSPSSAKVSPITEKQLDDQPVIPQLDYNSPECEVEIVDQDEAEF